MTYQRVKKIGMQARMFVVAQYPMLFMIGIVLVIYLPYLSGLYDLTGPGALTRRETWQFVLSPHFGWVDFYKNMGEFVGAMYHFGFLNPFMQMIRIAGIVDPSRAEAILTVMYAGFTLAAGYVLYRRTHGYTRWIALFATTIFFLNGSTFTTDANTSETLANMFYLPLLMILAEGELRGVWRKIAYAALLGLEATNGHPQYVLWQMILVGTYLLYVKGWKTMFPYACAMVLAGCALVPSIGFTELMYRGYDTQQYVQPFALSWKGNSLSSILQMLTPFFPADQIGYITPYYYTILLATLIFFLCVPVIVRTWREVPRSVRFFTVAGVFFLIGSFEGSFIQEFLKSMPVFNIILARNTYRFTFFYFFAVSFVVPYCMAMYLRTKADLTRFARFALWFGFAAIVGLCVATLVYVLYGDVIYAILKTHFVSERLPNVRGKYDPEYYFNLLRWYYDLYAARLTLASIPGVLSALPYASLAVWGYAVVKAKCDPLRSFVWLVFAQICFGALLFSAVLAQDAWRVPHNDSLASAGAEQYMRAKPQAHNSYVMAYGQYAGMIYMENLYKGSLDIRRWLNANEYDNFISYNPIPRTQSEIAPFRLFRDRLLATYIGFQLGDLFDLRGSFRDNEKSNPDILNPLSVDKANLDSAVMSHNLESRLGILRAIGVRFIVSQYDLTMPGVRLLHVVAFPRKSDLLPQYAATLYVYELTNPGTIVFVPSHVQVAPLDAVDVLDFSFVKEIYDNLNYRGISFIESSGMATSTLKTQGDRSSAVLIARDRDDMRVRAHMKQSGYIVVNSYYYPGWIAFADGKEIPVSRANLNFIAVFVPEGDHDIEIRFDIYRMIRGMIR